RRKVTECVPVTRCRTVRETVIERVPTQVTRMQKVTEMREVRETRERMARGCYVPAGAAGNAPGAVAGGPGCCGQGAVAPGCPTYGEAGPGRVFVEGASCTRQVPVTVTRMVRQTEVRRVPVTVTRTVCETVMKQVPCKVTTMRQETVTKMVRETVCRQVPCTTRVKVPYTVTEMVPVCVTKRVPVQVPAPCQSKYVPCETAPCGPSACETECRRHPVRDFLSRLCRNRMACCEPCGSACEQPCGAAAPACCK